MTTHKSLIDAIRAGSYDSILSLLQSGTDPNAIDGIRRPLLQAVIQRNRCVRTIDLLLQFGAKPDFAIFKVALIRYDVNTIKKLIKHGANPNGHNPGDISGLHVVCFSNHPDRSNVCKLLIKHGAQVNYENSWYDTPLYCAVSVKNVEVIETLLQHGAKPCFEYINASPLAYSFGRVPVPTINLMIKYAALQINQRNDKDLKDFLRNFGNKKIHEAQEIPGKLHRTIAKCCLKEIEVLKGIKFCESEKSLFDFTLSEETAIDLQVNAKHLQTVLGHLPDFPLYSDILLKRVNLDLIEFELVRLSPSIYWSYKTKAQPVILDIFILENITKHLTKLDVCNLYIAVALAGKPNQ